MTNNTTEKKAIELALLYEKERLKLSNTDCIKSMPKCTGYDLESPDGRKIEVKGSEGSEINKGFVLNSGEEIEHVDSGGYIYRILNVFTTPVLYVLTKENVQVTERRRADVRVPKNLVPAAIETNAF